MFISGVIGGSLYIYMKKNKKNQDNQIELEPIN
jgi:hypothetical protein